MTLTVTVLVPAHQEAGTITRCLAAIAASTYPIARTIVVADACTDTTAALAKQAGAEVHLTWAGDKAAAQNHVLASIDTDLVVGVDGDTFLRPDTITRMVAALEDRALDAVCATVLPAQPRGFYVRARRYAYALGRRWWRAAQSAVGRVQVLTGACYTFRTAAIKQVGGFPTVGISADMDATWALHRAGYRLAYVGDAIADTLDPETFAAYRAQMRRWAAGFFQTMAKHRRGLLHPRALLVVGTALFDLLTLPVTYLLVGWWALVDPARVRWFPAWFAAHLLITTVLVATVVGPKEALLGAIPYTVVNGYNKALYLWTMVREWLLGAHYASWTGRAGRATVITPPSPRRLLALATLGAAAAGVALGVTLPGPHPFGPPTRPVAVAGGRHLPGPAHHREPAWTNSSTSTPTSTVTRPTTPRGRAATAIPTSTRPRPTSPAATASPAAPPISPTTTTTTTAPMTTTTTTTTTTTLLDPPPASLPSTDPTTPELP